MDWRLKNSTYRSVLNTEQFSESHFGLILKIFEIFSENYELQLRKMQVQQHFCMEFHGLQGPCVLFMNHSLRTLHLF